MHTRRALLAYLAAAPMCLIGGTGCTARSNEMSEVKIRGVLRLLPAASGHPLMAAIEAALREDPEQATDRGIELVHGTYHTGTPPTVQPDPHLTGPDAATLKTYIRDLQARSSAVSIDDAHELMFEPTFGAEGEVMRTHLVTRAGALELRSLQRAWIEDSPHDGSPEVMVALQPADAAAFHALTRANTGHKIIIAHDATVLAAPVVVEPIPGGQFSLPVRPPSPTAARELLARLTLS